MKWKVVENAWWMFWAAGMVCGPWIWMKKKDEDFVANSEYHRRLKIQNAEWNKRLFRHELQHCYQMKRLGWWRFHWEYLKELVKNGYRQNKFEVEAYDIDNTPLTPKELHWYTNGKVEL